MTARFASAFSESNFQTAELLRSGEFRPAVGELQVILLPQTGQSARDATKWNLRNDVYSAIRIPHSEFVSPTSCLVMIAFALPILVAETEAPPWPDGIDWVLTTGYLALILGLPLLGYLVMYFDFRRYLRSLRRALVFVAYSVQSMPYWALRERPSCLAALDLHLPCTEEDVMAAYRKRVKALHPDRGGDLRKFLRLQKQFEQALHLVRCQTKASTTASN